MFYSGEDYRIWKIILGDAEDDAGKIAMSKLTGMSNFCSSAGCRHQTILNYFGQSLDKDNCNACDMCLGEIDSVDGPLEKAQKILSCVVRLEERFGSHYTTLVLTGSKEKRISELGHDSLSTYGILSEHNTKAVRDWVEQLIGQGYIEKTGEYNVLHVTPKGWEVLRGNTVPRLLKPAVKAKKVSRVIKDSWEGVDQGLFEVLRQLRKEIAGKKGLPAFVVFGDAALRDMARRQPTTHTQFLEIKGVGEAKDEQYGDVFIEAITEHCGVD
jgi:ATP-dependent DNA helicase RecQ